MAMQASLGATKFVILCSAGLAGSVLIKNNKLGDFIGDLSKVLSKHLREGDDGEAGSNDAALSQQVKRLAQELRMLASSSRTVTVVQAGNGSGVSFTTFVLPAAVVGAVGYGYMKWKGFSFSSIMYVTKKGLNTAVEQMGKQLDHVSAALSSTRKHMNQRLDTVNGKLDESIVMTGLIRDQVEEVKSTVGRSIYEIDNVSQKMGGLGLKIDEIQESQTFANQGIFLLVEWVHRQFPNQHPELAQSFKSWYLKASSMDKDSAFPGLITSPGLKQFFSQPLESQPSVPQPLLPPSNFCERAPVRNMGESRPPGLNMPSPGLGLSANASIGLPRTSSSSILSRVNMWGNSGLAGFTGTTGMS
ncbi:hypothetical protein KC19_2G257300 [Ceratodon purpureus]|uniref:DUF1664 domain-containing protein n=1 Tax=Ceratodon purpureus TaxID=3225 RepID=A0A8T0J0X4_CERPU|nr:hypothetical protein KC19_2G257300 [Ceratodon purpureus]